MPDPFGNADFYDVDAGRESLRYDSLEELFADEYEDEDEYEEELEVIAFNRKVIGKSDVEDIANQAAETARELLYDEFGGDEEHVLSDSAHAELSRGFAAVLARVIREHGDVWQCEEVARRTFSAEEIEGILGEKR